MELLRALKGDIQKAKSTKNSENWLAFLAVVPPLPPNYHINYDPFTEKDANTEVKRRKICGTKKGARESYIKFCKLSTIQSQWRDVAHDSISTSIAARM